MAKATARATASRGIAISSRPAISALATSGPAPRRGALRPGLRPDEVLPLVCFLRRLDTRTDPRVPQLLDLVLGAATPGPRPAGRAPGGG